MGMLEKDIETGYEKHCRLRAQFVKHLWDNDLLEEYHNKLIEAGIMVENAPEEFDAFEYNYQYEENIETIFK